MPGSDVQKLWYQLCQQVGAGAVGGNHSSHFVAGWLVFSLTSQDASETTKAFSEGQPIHEVRADIGRQVHSLTRREEMSRVSSGWRSGQEYDRAHQGNGSSLEEGLVRRGDLAPSGPPSGGVSLDSPIDASFCQGEVLMCLGIHSLASVLFL